VVKRSDNKRVDLHCSLWPDPTKKDRLVLSKAKSREIIKIGTNCLYKIQIWLRKNVDLERYKVVVKYSEYNHSLVLLNLLVLLRQKERKEKEERLLDYFEKGLKPIAISMLLEPEKSLLNLKDLENLRARTRLIFLRGRISIKVVIESLPS
jgi:hypothetical protein